MNAVDLDAGEHLEASRLIKDNQLAKISSHVLLDVFFVDAHDLLALELEQLHMPHILLIILLLFSVYLFLNAFEAHRIIQTLPSLHMQTLVEFDQLLKHVRQASLHELVKLARR